MSNYLRYLIISENINCKSLSLRLEESDEFVGDLQDRIYNRHILLKDKVGYNSLKLYKPDDLKINDEGNLEDRALASIAGKEFLYPLESVDDVFGQDLDVPHLVHLVVKVLPQLATVPKRSRSPSEDDEGARLKKILKRAPSSLSTPNTFKDFVPNPIHLNRPFDNKLPVPIELLQSQFGEFKDDCAMPPTPWAQGFLQELTPAACKWYKSETYRRSAIQEVFNRGGIYLWAEAIPYTEYSTDGNSQVTIMPSAVRKCKNEAGSGSALFEAIGLYAQFLNNARKRDPYSRFPCVLMIDFGSYIGFYGCLWTGKNICVEPLTPMYDLTIHLTDETSSGAIASSLDAFKNTIDRLQTYYESFSHTLPPTTDRTFPYPTSYTDDTNQNVDFTYQSRVPEKLVFVALTDGIVNQTLCIKFTRRYSEIAHRLLAEQGYAPQLRKVTPLPGNWTMVVMDLSQYRLLSDYTPPSNASRNLVKSKIQEIVETLHSNNMVHGDIRENNILVDPVTLAVQFIDFDWAGIHEVVRYPERINTRTVRRPHGVSDRELITKAHDLAMVDLLFF